MEPLWTVLGGFGVALLVAALLWLGGADVVGATILERTVEPLARWCMRVLFGIDKPLVGPEALVGAKAVAISTFDPSEVVGSFVGRVKVRSESWGARSAEPIPRGSAVRVVSYQGVFLNVERLGSN